MGAAALDMLDRPQRPAYEAALTSLINDLTGLPGKRVLVFEDYHVLATEQIHATVAYLLDHLPPGLHLILTTRHDPPLPLAEPTSSWGYYLPDGQATVRQLADGAGGVTLLRRYTPWGETLEQQGTGTFAWGYFGGLMDSATGLLYVGGGQYYDPRTGRALPGLSSTWPGWQSICTAAAQIWRPIMWAAGFRRRSRSGWR